MSALAPAPSSIGRGARASLVTTVADQFLSSGQNFVILILAARSSSAAEFGAFTLGLALLTLGVTLNQAVVAEPMLLRTSSLAPDEVRVSCWSARRGSTLLTTVLTTTLLVSAAVIPNARVSGTLFCCCLALPLLVALDMSRWTLMAMRKPRIMLATDGLWVGSWVIAFLVVRPEGAVDNLLVWSCTTAPGLLFAASILNGGRKVAGGQTGRSWLRENRASSAALTTEFLATNGSTQATSILVAAMVGLPQSGGFRAAQGLFGPINSLTNALRLGLVPEVIRSNGSRTPRGRKLLRLGLVTSLGCTAAAAAICLLLPEHTGHQLFGTTWPNLRHVLVPIVVGRIFGGAQIYPNLALRADMRLTELAKLRTYTSSFILLATVLGALMFGVLGAGWGSAIAGGVSYVAFEVQVRRGSPSPAAPS